MYPIVEIFQSIKGEGLWIGEPMLFVRLGTCNAHCNHCDTPYNVIAARLTAEEIVERLKTLSETLTRIVITGGEPTIHDLPPLLDTLREAGYSLHLESNGSKPIPWQFDFICVSPKLKYVPVDWEHAVQYAHEIKFPIEGPEDLMHAENFRAEYEKRFPNRHHVEWYLHPWNDIFQFHAPGFVDDGPGARTTVGMSPLNNKLCVEHALKTGRWRVSVQAHKLLGIP